MPTNEEQYLYSLEQDRLRYQRTREADLARQQQEQEQKAARMGWELFLFLLIVSLILDVIDFFSGGTIGWFIGFVGDIFLAAVTGMSKAGRKQFKKIVSGWLAEKIPIIDVLPFRAIFLTWGFISSRSATLQSVTKVATLGQAKQGSAALQKAT